jgi:hypothetical protein
VSQAALSLLAFSWGAITVVELLLCSVLWQRMSARWVRVSGWVYLGWALLATVAATIAANTLVREVYEPTLDASVIVLGWQTAWGFWLTALGLAAGWVAVGLLRGEMLRGQGEISPLGRTQAPRARLKIAGAAVVTAGALVWALGFVALPWATTNCATVTLSLNHYVNGTCAGLDAGDVLGTSLGLANHLAVSASPSEIALLAYGLLAGGALLVVIGSWRRRSAWTLCAWLTAWLVVAGVAALVALRGVGIIVRTVPTLSTASRGAWVPGLGVYVRLLGLLLVAGGFVALWWRALRGVHRPAWLVKARARCRC